MLAKISEESVAGHPYDEIVRLERLVSRLLSGRLLRFRIDFQETGLILQGSAATYHAKQLAQHAAMEATALPILANDIEVR